MKIFRVEYHVERHDLTLHESADEAFDVAAMECPPGLRAFGTVQIMVSEVDPDTLAT